MEQFKRVQVVMLPTKNNSNIIQNIYNLKLEIFINLNPKHTDFNKQHLYIISDDEIKEDDWTLCLDEIDTTVMNWNINQCIFKHKKGGNCTQCKKIIATTDTSLLNTINTPHISGEISKRMSDLFKLPQPSQQFIEKYIECYNKGEVITNVLVEYENIISHTHIIWGNEYIETLKINPKDNTITIKKLKDSWNRKEVIELIYKYCKEMTQCISEEDNKWIEENL